MYRPASFIITPNGVLWHTTSDSHSDILEIHGIRNESNTSNFVKVGIVPPDNNYKLPIERWKYFLDCDQKYIPEWFNFKEAEKACRLELKHWYAEKVIKKGTHTLSGKVSKIILDGNVTINDLENGSNIQFYGNAKFEINNMKDGAVWICNDSTGKINNQSGGNTWFYSNSTGELNNQSGGNVFIFHNSNVKVNNQKSGFVRFFHNSTGKVNKQSGGYIRFWDYSTGYLNNQSGGDVKFCEFSKQLKGE